MHLFGYISLIILSCTVFRSSTTPVINDIQKMLLESLNNHGDNPWRMPKWSNQTGFCSNDTPSQRLDCGWPGITSDECTERDCCFDETYSEDSEYPTCFIRSGGVYTKNQKCDFTKPHLRSDCGYPGMSPQECESRGCCSDNRVDGKYARHCFHSASGPLENTSYETLNWSDEIGTDEDSTGSVPDFQVNNFHIAGRVQVTGGDGKNETAIISIDSDPYLYLASQNMEYILALKDFGEQLEEMLMANVVGGLKNLTAFSSFNGTIGVTIGTTHRLEAKIRLEIEAAVRDIPVHEDDVDISDEDGSDE